LVLQLPDGSEHAHSFKFGATVAYVKLQVQQLYGLPMEKQVLQTGGKTLIDPRKHRPSMTAQARLLTGRSCTIMLHTWCLYTYALPEPALAACNSASSKMMSDLACAVLSAVSLADCPGISPDTSCLVVVLEQP
jgi:hypothetical protein